MGKHWTRSKRHAAERAHDLRVKNQAVAVAASGDVVEDIPAGGALLALLASILIGAGGGLVYAGIMGWTRRR